MAVKFVVAYRIDTNNVGDLASNPLQYFLDDDEYEEIDIAYIGSLPIKDDVPLIVGGGGLIGNENFGDIFYKFLKTTDKRQLEDLYENKWQLFNNKFRSIHEDFSEKFQDLVKKTIKKIDNIDRPKFVWGAGHNAPEGTDIDDLVWPESLAEYDLVGIRDYSTPSKFPWVPCASCMHSALRKEYPIKNDIIWFEHKKQLIRDFGSESIPRFVNSGSNIEQTIEILGSSNIILTNSYHGAYWGTLLKKRVVIVGPWSTKFRFMKYQPIIPNKKESWRSALERAVVFKDSLEDCIEVTERYWKKVKERV